MGQKTSEYKEKEKKKRGGGGGVAGFGGMWVGGIFLYPTEMRSED